MEKLRWVIVFVLFFFMIFHMTLQEFKIYHLQRQVNQLYEMIDGLCDATNKNSEAINDNSKSIRTLAHAIRGTN